MTRSVRPSEKLDWLDTKIFVQVKINIKSLLFHKISDEDSFKK